MVLGGVPVVVVAFAVAGWAWPGAGRTGLVADWAAWMPGRLLIPVPVSAAVLVPLHA